MDQVVIGDATLIHGDCREVLPTLRGHIAVTSPPYNQIDPTKMKPSGKYKASGDGWLAKIAERGYSDNLEELEYQLWLALIVRLTMNACAGLVWVNHKIRYRDGEAIHPVRFLPFPLYSEVIWARPGSMTLNAKRFAPSHEGFWGFGRPHYWNDKRNTDFTVWHLPPAKQQHGHTCAYPEKLIQPLIDASSEPGDVVIDPFMGSGTTGVVCADMGRKFIGIEIDRGYFDAACERLSESAKQDRLFV